MSETNPLLSPDDKALIKKWLIGGASIGGGLALTTSLINYLKHLNRNKAEEDDDTLYIVRKKEQEMPKAASIGGGLAISGGVLASLGTYALVRKIYEEIRKKEAQDELDKYQKAFLDVQGFEKADKDKLDKKASEAGSDRRPMSWSEAGWSMPVAIPLLVALGSGVMAKKILDNAYPVEKKKKPEGPKRIEIVDDASEIAEKVASTIPSSCGTELLLRTVHFKKEASSSVSDLITAVASGEAGRFEKAAAEIGYVNALSTVKGASRDAVDPVSEQIAITYLSKKASVAPQTAVVAASEYAEFYPNFFKIACRLPESKAAALEKIAKVLGFAFKHELFEDNGITFSEKDKELTKNAVASDFIMNKMMDAAVENGTPSKDKKDSKDDEGGKKGVKYIYSSKKGLRLAKMLQDEDAIDKILNPS